MKDYETRSTEVADDFPGLGQLLMSIEESTAMVILDDLNNFINLYGVEGSSEDDLEAKLISYIENYQNNVANRIKIEQSDLPF